jgi:hypothetical protein
VALERVSRGEDERETTSPEHLDPIQVAIAQVTRVKAMHRTLQKYRLELGAAEPLVQWTTTRLLEEKRQALLLLEEGGVVQRAHSLLEESVRFCDGKG